MSGTPILPKEEKKVRQVSKGLSVKDKNKMCSIMGFLLYLKESGKMEETEAKRLMEELPLYSISRIQTEFFNQDAFDLKKVEVELWKPMVAENKLNKKNKKAEEKEKPKKERKVKNSDDDATKKRGRKAKKQIIEFENNNEDEVKKTEEDQLENLLNEMLETEEKPQVNESDLDAVLRELEEEGELVEEKIVEEVKPKKPKAKKEDKKSKAKKEEEVEVEEGEEVEEVEEKPKEKEDKKANKKKVKISQ